MARINKKNKTRIKSVIRKMARLSAERDIRSEARISEATNCTDISNSRDDLLYTGYLPCRGYVGFAKPL